MLWIGLILFLILIELSALRRHKDREAKVAEELRNQEEQRRIEEQKAQFVKEEAERAAEWKREEAAFWAAWNADIGGGIGYWRMKFENGPENFDDEYYEEFDEEFGPEWRHRLKVPPKGGYLHITAQLHP